MTALDQILTAEQDAGKVIVQAREAAETTIATARTVQAQTLQNERVRLTEEEQSVLSSFEKNVDKKVKDMDAVTAKEVDSVKEKFSGDKKAAVEAVISQL